MTKLTDDLDNLRVGKTNKLLIKGCTVTYARANRFIIQTTERKIILQEWALINRLEQYKHTQRYRHMALINKMEAAK